MPEEKTIEELFEEIKGELDFLPQDDAARERFLLALRNMIMR